jgi:Ca2+-transporting ATPase
MAVELGRGLYDNLTKYIRFQMGVLVGFIVTFLGASIFNVVAGVPFLPLQTLWVNFTTQVFQAVGLGYGKPSEGLMARSPRDPAKPILTRSLLLWLAFAGLVLGAGTLGVIWWAEDHRSVAIARTMGLTTFALANVFFSLEARDERRSIFNLDILDDRKFLVFTGASFAAIVVGPEIGLFQRILHTTNLTFREWLACIGVALTIIVVAEVRKVLMRRRDAAAVEAEESATAGVPLVAAP